MKTLTKTILGASVAALIAVGAAPQAAAATQTGWTGPTTPIDGQIYMHNSTVSDEGGLSASTRIWTMTGAEAPQGTMGVRARLFKSGVLCEAIDYQYNPWPATEMSYGTSKFCGDGWYNSHGFISVWNEQDQSYFQLPTFPTNSIWVTAANATETATVSAATATPDTSQGEEETVVESPEGFTPAYGDDGTIGLVQDRDLDSPLPENPADAAEQGSTGDRFIPLYDTNASQVIGTFTVSG